MPSLSIAAARRGLFALAIATARSASLGCCSAIATSNFGPPIRETVGMLRAAAIRAATGERSSCCDGTQLASRHAATRRFTDDDDGEEVPPRAPARPDS